MNNIKYIWLEPAAFLTDIDFQMMNAEQRGVYCSVIFYLYCNGGKLELVDNSDITLLHTKTSRLAIISGCEKTGSEWAAIWSKIADKFQISGNILTHRRVTSELEKAEKYIKAKSEAGKKGMASRYGDNKDITKVSKVKVSKVKISKKEDKKLKTAIPKEDKETFLQFVKLTKTEVKKLIEKMGQYNTDEYIERLNNYVGSKGKKYKSHYYTILNWWKKDNDNAGKSTSQRGKTTGRSFAGQESKIGKTIE